MLKEDRQSDRQKEGQKERLTINKQTTDSEQEESVRLGKGKERTGLNLQTSFTFADFLPSNNDDDMSSRSGHVSSIRLVQQGLLENDHFLLSRGSFEEKKTLKKNIYICRKHFSGVFCNRWPHALAWASSGSYYFAGAEAFTRYTYILLLCTLFSLHTINRPWTKNSTKLPFS
jgi:hypothetical protein